MACTSYENTKCFDSLELKEREISLKLNQNKNFVSWSSSLLQRITGRHYCIVKDKLNKLFPYNPKKGGMNYAHSPDLKFSALRSTEHYFKELKEYGLTFKSALSFTLDIKKLMLSDAVEAHRQTLPKFKFRGYVEKEKIKLSIERRIEELFKQLEKNWPKEYAEWKKEEAKKKALLDKSVERKKAKEFIQASRDEKRALSKIEWEKIKRQPKVKHDQLDADNLLASSSKDEFFKPDDVFEKAKAEWEEKKILDRLKKAEKTKWINPLKKNIPQNKGDNKKCQAALSASGQACPANSSVKGFDRHLHNGLIIEDGGFSMPQNITQKEAFEPIWSSKFAEFDETW